MPKAKITNNKWEADIEVVSCSECRAPTVYIAPLVHDKVSLLLEAYPNTEWLGYLVGKDTQSRGVYRVTDLVIPKHELVAYAHCVAAPFQAPTDCVGVLHSHHRMGAFHSKQDNDCVDLAYPVSITVGLQGDNIDYDAVGCVTTACGKQAILPCAVKFGKRKLSSRQRRFLADAKQNVDAGKPKAPQVTFPFEPGYPSLEDWLMYRE